MQQTNLRKLQLVAECNAFQIERFSRWWKMWRGHMIDWLSVWLFEPCHGSGTVCLERFQVEITLAEVCHFSYCLLQGSKDEANALNAFCMRELFFYIFLVWYYYTNVRYKYVLAFRSFEIFQSDTYWESWKNLLHL